MSVTFAVEQVTTGRIIVEGYDWAGYAADKVTLATFATYDEYRAHVDAVGCRDLLWTGYDWYPRRESVTDDAPEVNMANGNARDVLNALGLFTDDLCGSEDGATFRSRVLVAMMGYEGGDGIDAYTVQGEGGATFHHCGRPEGYVAERLSWLLGVAEAAEALGLAVVWS